MVVAAIAGCGSHIEPAGASKDDAGPALRGHVGDDDGGGGGELDGGADLPPATDARPVTDATVSVDAIIATDVPPSIDATHADSGKPDTGPPDLGPPDLGPPDLGPDLPLSGCAAPATRELLANPAFDLDLLETGWTNPGAQIVYQALAPGAPGTTNQPDVAAQSLPNLAWFGGLGSADDRLSQSIAVPAGASNLTVSFFYAVVTGKTGTTELDTFDATLLAGAQVISVAHLSNLNATDTWTPVSVALPAALAGQTVTLQLRGVTNANTTRFTSFYIDTMSFGAVACP